jgi:hypothetical protein
MIAARLILAAALVASIGRGAALTVYNGNCLACTAVGYYCSTQATCWSDSICGSSVCGSSTCLSSTSQCSGGSSSTSRFPAYDNNCVACAGPYYYCPTSRQCWRSRSPCEAGCTAVCYGSTSSCSGSSSGTTVYSGYSWTARHSSGSTRSSWSSSQYSSALRSPTSMSSSCSALYSSNYRSGTAWRVSFRFTGSLQQSCDSSLYATRSSSISMAQLSTAFVSRGYGSLSSTGLTRTSWNGLAVAVAALGAAILAVIVIGIVCCCCITGLIIYCACFKKSTTVIVQQAPTPMNQPYQGA